MRFLQEMYASLGRAKVLLIGTFAFALAACGGGGGGGNGVGPAGGLSGSGSQTGTGGTGGTTQTVISFGAMINGAFVTGQADVSVDMLSAGGTAEVTVNLVDQDNNPITDTFTINFTSGCVADGTATLDTGVATTQGQASAEYVANGCVGADEIRATVDVDGQTLTAIATITIAQEAIGSIEFVSADPTQIALSGTGGDETSRVTFRVLGEAGGPIEDAAVTFSLNSTTGGLDLTTTTGTSNSAGEVSTIVQSGTIATSVRVTATEDSTGISTQSSQLTVSTGIPDSDSFSLALSVFNPEGLNRDGETLTATVRAADAFNNPVPENTAISFFTEGGSIDPTCATDVTGACSVTWRSQDPRPTNGRVTILATAIGNESFDDQDGDGRYDDGEPFEDLGEAFADEDESGTYDGGEFFIDFGPNGTPNGARDLADLMYNGVLCADDATNCSDDRTLIVSEANVISMSGSFAFEPALFDVSTAPATALVTPLAMPIIFGTPVQVFGQDLNGNSMPGGTTVRAEVTTGLRIEGDATWTVPTTTPNAGFMPSAFTVVQANTATTSGTLTITFTTPSGAVTVYGYDLSE
ncbi:MAG: hypothetical protein AAF541_04225 [Pseudomonadota bacterium]